MVVTWVTLSPIADNAHVWFGSTPDNLNHKANAEVTHFTESLTTLYTYRALLTGLSAATTYCKCDHSIIISLDTIRLTTALVLV